MSHFRAVKTKLKDTIALIAALKDMGLEMELYGKATADNKQCQRVMNYYHYQGNQLGQEIVLGDIIVRRDKIKDPTNSQGRALDDLGFTWNAETEVYDITMSDRDCYINWNINGEQVRGAAEFTKLLFSKYSFHQAHNIARSMGGTVQTKTLEGGRRQYTIVPGAAKAQVSSRR